MRAVNLVTGMAHFFVDNILQQSDYLSMATPNKTVCNWRNRKFKFAVVATNVFHTRRDAEEWLATQAAQEGDSKRVRPFKTGPRNRTVLKYHASIYRRITTCAVEVDHAS